MALQQRLLCFILCDKGSLFPKVRVIFSGKYTERDGCFKLIMLTTLTVLTVNVNTTYKCPCSNQSFYVLKEK